MSQSRPSRLATIVATAGITAAAVAAGSAGAFDLPHLFGGSVASTATAASGAAAAPAAGIAAGDQPIGKAEHHADRGRDLGLA